MTQTTGFRAVLLVAFLAGTRLVPAAWDEAPGVERTRERLEQWVGHGAMRLPGAPANLELQQAIAERFAESGFQYGDIEFTAPTFIPGPTRLTAGDVELVLHPMHPSLFRPGNFKQRRFDTDIIDLRSGSAADLDAVSGIDLHGKLVLMDFHSGRAWERLLRFGVEGFIFVGADHYEITDAYDKVPTSEVVVPRFFIDAADGDTLRQAMQNRRLAVRIDAEPSRWESRILRNPWVMIPGTDRELQSDVVVFTAPMDANNVVPSMATGAEAAANLNLLMELFDEFSRNPPPRTVLLAAVNARTQNYLGDRLLAWYLMAPESAIEQVRNGLSADMRLQELIVEKMSTLEFEPHTREQDEKFLVELRTLTDDSIGRQITVKDPIVALSKRDVNEIKGQRLWLFRERLELNRELSHLDSVIEAGGTETLSLDDARAERDRLQARIGEIDQTETRLEAKQDQFVNVLTLFNRVGIRTRLSDLDDTEERILRDYVATILARNRMAADRNREDLERSDANSQIRSALEGRNVSAVISLELTWENGRIGFSSGVPLGQPSWADRWGRNTMRLAGELADELNRPNLLVDTLTNVGGLPERFYVPTVSESVAVYQRAGRRPAFSLNNAFSTSGRRFTPTDTLDNLDLDTVAEITGFTRRFLAHTLTDPVITGSGELPPPPVDGQRLWSILVKAYKYDEFAAGVLPEIPVPGSVVILSPEGLPASGFSGPGIMAAYTFLTDDRAVALVYGIRETALASQAFDFDEDFVTVRHVVDAGETHQKMNSNISVTPMRILSLTEGLELIVGDRADPSLISSSPIYTRSFYPLSAIRNSEPRRYGIAGTASGLSTKIMPFQAWGPAAFYTPVGERLKLLTGAKRFAIHSTSRDPEGEGFAETDELGPAFFSMAMRDMDRLNRYRFDNFHGIADELVSDFLARGARAAEVADAARDQHDHLGYLRAVYEGLGAQVKAYSQIASITDDMLKAVVFYMALLLPFCFFVQKLLFKTTRIERQMGLFAVMFVACYVLFRFIHPAFRVAQAPEAMFIAFVMGGLGMFVIYILHGRFEGEMQLLFHTMTGQDESAVGYSMVSQQAMLIGVSNMKRRRIRTVLTTATIILVTFTMLAFTSVSRRMSPTLIPQDRPAPYTGLMYHWPGGQRMDEDTWSTLEQVFAGRADTLTRRWLMPPSFAGQTATFRVESPTGPTALIEGVLGLDPAEHGFLGPLPLIAGRFFDAPDAYEAVISASLAEYLEIDSDAIGEQFLEFRNRRLRVVGIVDDERLRTVEDINGLSILPIKQLLTPVGAGDTEPTADAMGEETGVFFVGTASMLMLPIETARRFGAAPYSLSVRFDDDADIWSEIDRLLVMTSARFFIGSREPFTVGEEGSRVNTPGVYFIGSGYRTSIGGLAMLIIPLLIASTIILNTMLGSVFERKKEIAVFNAVGLNPTHIGLFFLAESFVYGIIGSVGGYLIGQILSIVLNHFGWVEDINLNFSSLSVAYVILFTISIVLLSTLYPAAVATKAAVPSGKRKWSMPPHDGRVMDVVFPFIYQPNLAIGVMAYLNDFFAQFTEASTGDLIADRRDVAVTPDNHDRPVYRVVFHVALAPFDLGVTQSVAFTAAFDEKVDAYRVVMTVTRESGQDANWVTTNKPFLERLRKLLLQWRNMKPAEHGAYIRSGSTLFAEETHG